MTMEAQAAALAKMQAAMAAREQLIAQLGVDDGPGNPRNLSLIPLILQTKRDFDAAFAEYKAAGG
ncbi:hypothetical protein [Cellulomonas sp. A375-1]|uniref:hypothetical protein n=1 Tax=Cellulomonas sp. A375-1 TaxID=1672219 RepID=UPI000ABA171A|nr:hypothetical protein [Cellulomonas sp. A375-1]